MEKEKDPVVEDPIPPVLGKPKTKSDNLESNLFGIWTVRLRNIGGILSTLTVCVISLLYVFTIYVSVTNGRGWPDRTSLLIITCGPIIASFTFMDSGKILRILSQTGSVGEVIRRRAVNILQRPGDEPPPPKKED